MSAVLRGSSWVLSFVPLLSLGLLTWPLFAVLAIKTRSRSLAGAALGYLAVFVLETWAIRPDAGLVFDLCWMVLMLGGTAHAITVRRRWFRRAWPVAKPMVAQEPEVVPAATERVEYAPAAAAPEPAGEPVQRLLDEIDALVDDSLRGGEPAVGHYFGDPDYPDCPNPYCDESWHGLAITERMSQMRAYGEVDLDYDYHVDDSPVLCPGSTFDGAWEPVPAEAIAAWWDTERPVAPISSPPPDPQPDPLAEARERADRLWAAVARPAVLIVVASWLLSLVSMFLTAAQWRWPAVGVGVAAPMWLGWLYGRRDHLFPAGHLRARLRARPAALVAVFGMVCAGWLPLHWARNPPVDAATGYRTLLVAGALACVGHAVVQIARVRPVAGESPDEAAELDAMEHGESLFLRGFGWTLFGLPVTLLFGWILGYWAYQPRAMWVAVALLTILILTFFAEALTVKIWTGARDDGDLPMITFFTVAVTALLIWSILRIESATFAP
ncbi:hypothetical protein [Nocardia asteroides]|uniref:hypothetical protein n=1 Tax=Nocardia asteroides TaxID=1824 RepID=UPI003446C5ED